MEVTLIAALTADGLIAQDKNQISTAWTSKADRTWFAKTTKEIGVMIMGWNTFQTIGKPLSERLNIVYSLNPQESKQQYNFPNLEFTNAKPEQLIIDLEKRGYKQVAICGGATIYTLFLKTKLVNRIFFTIEPVVFGQGIRLLNEIIEVTNLELLNIQKLGDGGTVLLEYKVKL